MSTSAPVCKRCMHRQRTTLFDLCSHPSSHYPASGTMELHTCSHMLEGACFNGRLFVDSSERYDHEKATPR